MTSMDQPTEPLLLPSDIAVAEPVDKIPCGICKRQMSKYTCPSCNVSYCSLTCFRSQTHNQCSESFYRKEINTNLDVGPSETNKERLNMIELLTHFEGEVNDEDVWSSGDEEDSDENGLAKRFGDIDVECASPDALWSILTPEERNKFLKALDNTSSGLGQQLLASELERDMVKPWWEERMVGGDPLPATSKQFGSRPEFMNVPSSMVQPHPSGPLLTYNICAIFVAYAYTTRHLITSPLSSLPPDDPHTTEARRILSDLSPFVKESNSRTLHTSLSGAVTDTWSRFGEGKMTTPFFSLLLRDAAYLLRPQTVTVLSPLSTDDKQSSSSLGDHDLDSHPHRLAILVLSDLVKLFQSQNHPGSTKRLNHVTHKLTFYAGHILSLPSTVLSTLSDEISTRSETLETEVESNLVLAPMSGHAIHGDHKLVEESPDGR